jgi:hypothetical protein
MDTVMLVQGQTLVAALVAWLIQRVKLSQKFPAFSEQSSKLAKVVISAVLAAGSVLALDFTFDATAGTFIVTGLTWTNMSHGVVAFGYSLLIQHGTYEGLLKPKV